MRRSKPSRQFAEIRYVLVGAEKLRPTAAAELEEKFGIRTHLFLGLLGWVRQIWSHWPGPSVAKTTAGGTIVSLIAFATYYLLGTPATLPSGHSGLPVANQLLNAQFTLSAVRDPSPA